METIILILSAALLAATAVAGFYAARLGRANRRCIYLSLQLRAKEGLIETLEADKGFGVWVKSPIAADTKDGISKARKRLASRLGYLILRNWPSAVVTEEAQGGGKQLFCKFIVRER